MEELYIISLSHNMEYISYIVTSIKTVFSGWKYKAIVACFIAIHSFFFDPSLLDAQLALFFLVIFDFLSAILAAFKSNRRIRSRGIFKTALKIAVYFSIVAAGHITEKAVPIPFVDETLIGFLVATEFVSILENVARAGFAVPTRILGQFVSFKEKK